MPANADPVEQVKNELGAIFGEHEVRLDDVEQGLNDAFGRLEEVEEVVRKSTRRVEDAADAVNAAFGSAPKTTRDRVYHELQAVAIVTGRALIGLAVLAIPIMGAVLVVRKARNSHT